MSFPAAYAVQFYFGQGCNIPSPVPASANTIPIIQTALQLREAVEVASAHNLLPTVLPLINPFVYRCNSTSVRPDAGSRLANSNHKAAHKYFPAHHSLKNGHKKNTAATMLPPTAYLNTLHTSSDCTLDSRNILPLHQGNPPLPLD
jgi:hypothetical protein